MRPLLAILATSCLGLWALTLATAAWLGIGGRTQPVFVDAPPRLVVTGGSTLAALRRAAAEASITSEGAWWCIAGAGALTDATASRACERIALEVPAEDAGRAGALPSHTRLDRLGGTVVLSATLPDRGALTERFALPWLHALLTEQLDVTGAQATRVTTRRDGRQILLEVVVDEHPLGTRAANVDAPHLEAPRWPISATDQASDSSS